MGVYRKFLEPSILALILVALIGLGVYFVFDTMGDAGFESCVASIESGIIAALIEGELKQRILVTDEWRTLDEEEKRILFDQFNSGERNFDCYRFQEYSDGSALKDDKGTIKVRRDGQFLRVRIEVTGRTRQQG